MRARAFPLALLILAGILGGCAAFSSPQSLEHRLAYAYGLNTAVRHASASSAEAGAISAGELQAYMAANDRAREFLDAARLAAGAGDVRSAEGQLALALALLTEMQSRLNK